MKKALIIGTAVVVLGAAGGFAAMRLIDQPSEDVAIELIPADSYVYGNVFIKPSGDQKRALDDLLGNFPRIESTDEAINRLTGLIDEQLQEIGLSYDDDVEPWLGDQVSFFLSGTEIDPPDAAGLLETTDPGAAADAIEKLREASDDPLETEEKTYEGVDYEVEVGTDEPAAFGFVEDFLVIGTEGGFQAVVDAGQDPDEGGLADSEQYKEAFEGLDENSILSIYVDQTRLFELLEESGELGGQELAIFNTFPGLRDAGTAAVVLSARSDGVAIQTSSTIPEDETFSSFGGLYAGTDLIRELPGDAWFAAGIPDLGTTVSTFLDTIADVPGGEGAQEEVSRAIREETGLDLERDILSWMGDAALFVQGTNFQEIGGGVVIESSDSEKTRDALDALANRIGADVPLTEEQRGEYEGYSVSAGTPAPIYALVADRLLLTYGERATDAAVSPDETLADSERFETAEAALGDGFDPTLFVDLDAVFELVEFAQGFSGQTDPTYERDVKPWVDPLSYLVAGAREDNGRVFQTIFVGVEQEESS